MELEIIPSTTTQSSQFGHSTVPESIRQAELTGKDGGNKNIPIFFNEKPGTKRWYQFHFNTYTTIFL